MRNTNVLFTGLLVIMLSGCVPVEKMARHDFGSGYYNLKKPDSNPARVYASVIEDSIIVYPINKQGEKETPDISSFPGIRINNIKAGNTLFKSCFVKNSIDVDLTTVILKYRPKQSGVPNQLSSNINAAFYVGLRRDFYKLIPYRSPLKEESSYLRQIGFDAGFFAGIGISPINPTVTLNSITQEYDGIIFQKGVAGFITFDNLSVGLALGFDNLLDNNKSLWIYNQKPYIGLVIGISNF